MRGERIFALVATEEGDASDIAQTTVAFVGMTERFRFIAAAGARPIDEGQATYMAESGRLIDYLAGGPPGKNAAWHACLLSRRGGRRPQER